MALYSVPRAMCVFKGCILLNKSENTGDTSQLLLRTNRHIYGDKNELSLIASVSGKFSLKKTFSTSVLWESFMFHDSNR